LIPAYLGPEGVLTGSARLIQENKAAAEQQVLRDEMERKKMALHHRRKALEAQVATLQSELLAQDEEFDRLSRADRLRTEQLAIDRVAVAGSRQSRPNSAKTPSRS
jgi:circadian clock protein KaiC